jgi:hypothetical protein
MSTSDDTIQTDDGMQLIPISHTTTSTVGSTTAATTMAAPTTMAPTTAPTDAGTMQPHDGLQYIPISNEVTAPAAPTDPYTVTIQSQVPAGSTGTDGYVNVLYLLENLNLTTNGSTVSSPANTVQLGYSLQQVHATSVDSSGNATHVAQFVASPIDATQKSGFTILTFGRHVALQPNPTTVTPGP